MCVCMYMCICVYMYVWVCVCMFMYIYIYITMSKLKPGLGVETAYYGKGHELEKTLANSENGREARQQRRIGGRTRRRGDGGWAVRGATPSGRATLRIFRCVATNG